MGLRTENSGRLELAWKLVHCREPRVAYFAIRRQPVVGATRPAFYDCGGPKYFASLITNTCFAKDGPYKSGPRTDMTVPTFSFEIDMKNGWQRDRISSSAFK